MINKEDNLFNTVQLIGELNKKSIIEMEYIGIKNQRMINSIMRKIDPHYTPESYIERELDDIICSLQTDDILFRDTIDSIRSAVEKFESAMVSKLVDILSANAVALQRILSQRSGGDRGRLRLSVKLVRNVSHDIDSTLITELFRIPNSTRFDDFRIGENSGFKQVTVDGSNFYLCNDIPEYAQSRYKNEGAHTHYVNRRLNQARVDEYAAKLASGTIKADAEFDSEWLRCWDVDQTLQPPAVPKGGAYKSTILAPIYLGGDNYAEEFVECWDNQRTGAMRVVYAYLCLDHTSVNYFDHVSKSLVLYFAECMAAFFFLRERWVARSLTIRAVKRLISCQGIL